MRLLVAEDSADDFEILLRELRRGGYQPTAVRVASLALLQDALQQPWDLVISDWTMPGFGGRIVLDTLAARRLQIPCIVISGTIGEEPAVEALRAGALDFLSKDKPKRFVPAVQRALREAMVRRQTGEVRERSEQLERQNRRIQEASRLKSEFLANMSHELRTPLNAIIGFAEILHDGQVDVASPQHQEFLGDILTSGRHLLQLINDVLDLAKVEAGKLEFRPERIQIARLIREVSAILRTALAEKRITLATKIDPTVTELILDPGRLKQVAYNYLSNALKFTAAGGLITIRVSAEGDEHFRLEVEDSGIGIAPPDLGKLFVEFQQLESGTAKRHQGTGLGLALTKRLVEAQRGTVGVTSEQGKGSTFFAVLPRHTSVTIEDTPLPMLPIAREGARTVLVVEDDAADQAQLVSALASAGYAVELARTGAEALSRWRARDFDAMTIDLLLPDMSGLDLLAALHGERRNATIPVIVVTVVPDANVVAGFAVHDVIYKPFDGDTLIASLVRAGVESTATREA